MTGYFETNYNYYQDPQTTQDQKQSSETTSKRIKNEPEKGENTSTDVAGKGSLLSTLCI